MIHTAHVGPGAGAGVWLPQTVEEAWNLKKELGAGALWTAGGTWLRTRWEAGLSRMPEHLISLELVEELQAVHSAEGMLKLGAAVRLAACRRQRNCGLLAEASRHIAAPSIRQLATLGGNVAVGSGDALPALLVKEAVLHWYGSAGRSREALPDWLERRRAEAPPGALQGEEERLLTAVELCEDAAGDAPGREFGFYHKTGRREMFVPSLVTAAGCVRLGEDGRVLAARLAVGGGASIPQRLPDTESLLRGAVLPLTGELLQSVHSSVLGEWAGLQDAFASAAYRRMAAANLITAALWTQGSGTASSGGRPEEEGLS